MPQLAAGLDRSQFALRYYVAVLMTVGRANYRVPIVPLLTERDVHPIILAIMMIIMMIGCM
jgi:hypothetical protein